MTEKMDAICMRIDNLHNDLKDHIITEDSTLKAMRDETQELKIEVMKNNFVRTGIIALLAGFAVALTEVITKKLIP